MKYLFLMTAAGSVLFICYWVWSKVFAPCLTHSVRYKALVLVVLVFLIPWVWLKGIYSYVVRWFLQVRVPVVNGHPVRQGRPIRRRIIGGSWWFWEYG